MGSARRPSFAVLTAYFDDSGTHNASKIVVVAGLMGTESEVLSLEGMWRDRLDDPVCGLRSPIREFHAFDCDNSMGEFAGWKRIDTDYFRYQLREVIIQSHVGGFGFACVRQDWDEIIQGDLRDLLGNSEGTAVRNCFVRSLIWAQINSFDPDIAFIFDDSDKLERKRDIMAVYDAFKRETVDKNVRGLAFLDSKESLSLQAADLFAWEYNRNAHEILDKGIQTPSTTGMLHFAKGMGWLDGQIAQRRRIIEVRDFAQGKHPSDELAQMGAYFRNFGRR